MHDQPITYAVAGRRYQLIDRAGTPLAYGAALDTPHGLFEPTRISQASSRDGRMLIGHINVGATAPGMPASWREGTVTMAIARLGGARWADMGAA